jgi:hypothetical protein
VPVELLCDPAEGRIEADHTDSQHHHTVDDFLSLLPKELVDPALFLRTGWFTIYPCIFHSNSTTNQLLNLHQFLKIDFHFESLPQRA